MSQDKPNIQQTNTTGTYRRRKVCPFSGDDAPTIDYKDVELLKRYISDYGKITPSRITGVSNRYQRDLTSAIKRARHLALLPYCDHKD